jgi:hypothetical protein
VPALSEYPNVWDTAIAVLEQKGYAVWHDRDSDMFGAEREGWDFLADSPIALLGLVAIYEHKHPDTYTEYWWRTQPTHTSLALPSAPPPYTPITRR